MLTENDIPFWLIKKNAHVRYDLVRPLRGEILNTAVFKNGAEKIAGGDDWHELDMYDVIRATYPNGASYVWKAELVAYWENGSYVFLESVSA